VIKNLPSGVDFLLGNDIWALSHTSDCDELYEAVVTRSKTAAIAKSFRSKAVDSKLPQLNLNPTSVSLEPNTRNDAMVRVDSVKAHKRVELNDITSSDEFRSLQQQDPSLLALYDLVESSPYPVSRAFFFMQDNILMHHEASRKQTQESNRLVAPQSLREKLLHLAHDIPASGHLGVAKTKARLSPHFYWPHMSKHVIQYVRSCDICQRLGKGQKPRPAPLIPLPLVTEPFSRIAIDIVGPLPVCPKSGNRFILTILDLATHYPEAIPLPDHTAQRVATALAGVFSRFGFPNECLSDQGTDFMSQLMQIFMQDFKITQIRCSAWHPQSNGSCERFHGTLKSMIRSLTAAFKDAWDECLPWILFAYREIPMETLGFSPFEMLFGRSVRGPLALLKSAWKPTVIQNAKPNVIQYMLDLREKLKNSQEIALNVLYKQKQSLKLGMTKRHATGLLNLANLSSNSWSPSGSKILWSISCYKKTRSC